MGTNVYTEQIKTPEHNHKLVLNLPGGVYFATIFRNGKTVTKKIVITKNGDY